jgi:hypothetical protein
MPKPPRYYGIEKIVQLHQTRKASLVPTSANNGVIQWKQYKGNKTRDQTLLSPKLVLKRVSLLVLDKAIHNWGLKLSWVLDPYSDEKALIQWRKKPCQIKILQISWTETQFDETVPNFAHFLELFLFGYPIEPCIEIWQIFLNFGQNLAIR